MSASITIPAPLPDEGPMVASLGVAVIDISQYPGAEAAITDHGHLWSRAPWGTVVVITVDTDDVPYGDQAAVLGYRRLCEAIDRAEADPATPIDCWMADALRDYAGAIGDYEWAWSLGRALAGDPAAGHAAEVMAEVGGQLPEPLEPPTEVQPHDQPQ